MPDISISGDLWAELKAISQAQGASLEELAEKALGIGLENESWRELLQYGAQRGASAGFREEQAGDIVLAWREKRRCP